MVSFYQLERVCFFLHATIRPLFWLLAYSYHWWLPNALVSCNSIGSVVPCCVHVSSHCLPGSSTGSRYINWLKESQPEDLQPWLQACAQAFETDGRYVSDIRYLRVWVQYVRQPLLVADNFSPFDLYLSHMEDTCKDKQNHIPFSVVCFGCAHCPCRQTAAQNLPTSFRVWRGK